MTAFRSPQSQQFSPGSNRCCTEPHQEENWRPIKRAEIGNRLKRRLKDTWIEGNEKENKTARFILERHALQNLQNSVSY